MAPPDIPGEGQKSPHAAHGPHTLTFSEILVGLGDGSSTLAVSEIVAAFGAPENAGKGAINLKGRMVEKLHAEQA